MPESPTEVLLHFRLGVQGYFKLQSLFACAKFVVYFVMCPKLVFVKATESSFSLSTDPTIVKNSQFIFGVDNKSFCLSSRPNSLLKSSSGFNARWRNCAPWPAKGARMVV